MIRVLLVDDNASTRFGFRLMLDGEDDIKVVGEASDGEGGIMACRALRPDVVLMDVRMPRLDGIEATRAITGGNSPASGAPSGPPGRGGSPAQARQAGQREKSADGPDAAAPRVLILTTFDLDEYAFEGLRAGASGFLLKDVTAAQLVAAVRAVRDGDAVVTPRITRRLLEESRLSSSISAVSEDPAFALLTPREREIAEAIAEGLTNGEIAQRFFVTPGTVKTYVSRILAKLGARDRVEIVLRFHRGARSARDS